MKTIIVVLLVVLLAVLLLFASPTCQVTQVEGYGYKTGYQNR